MNCVIAIYNRGSLGSFLELERKEQGYRKSHLAGEHTGYLTRLLGHGADSFSGRRYSASPFTSSLHDVLINLTI